MFSMNNFSRLHPQILSFSGSFWETPPITDTVDFFRSRLDQLIDLHHPLAVLLSRMPLQEKEASLAHLFAKAMRVGLNNA